MRLKRIFLMLFTMLLTFTLTSCVSKYEKELDLVYQNLESKTFIKIKYLNNEIVVNSNNNLLKLTSNGTVKYYIKNYLYDVETKEITKCDIVNDFDNIKEYLLSDDNNFLNMHFDSKDFEEKSFKDGIYTYQNSDLKITIENDLFKKIEKDGIEYVFSYEEEREVLEFEDYVYNESKEYNNKYGFSCALPKEKKKQEEMISLIQKVVEELEKTEELTIYVGMFLGNEYTNFGYYSMNEKDSDFKLVYRAKQGNSYYNEFIKNKEYYTQTSNNGEPLDFKKTPPAQYEHLQYLFEYINLPWLTASNNVKTLFLDDNGNYVIKTYNQENEYRIVIKNNKIVYVTYQSVATGTVFSYTYNYDYSIISYPNFEKFLIYDIGK